MKKTKLAGISLLALLSLFLVLTTCTLEPQIDQLLEDVIDSKTVTYTVTTDGKADTATSTKLTFAYSSDPGTLAAKDITLADGTASASKGALDGTGTMRTLTIVPYSQGSITVKITKAGIESAGKTVGIFKKADTVSLLAIGGVSVPVTGGKPVTAVTETAQYSGTINWSPNAATFAPSTAYTATITLKPKAGYTLSGVGANTFTVAGALSVTHPANSGIIIAVFPVTTAFTVDTTVNLLAIGGVTVPVTGAKPVAAVAETAQYTGTVTWTPNDAVFAASTAYTAKITLTAKSGYTLIGVEANTFTVAGALVAANPVNSGVITATFPATTTSDTIVTIRAIGGVTVPVTGEKPVAAVTETAQYSGTVTWSPNDAVFAASTAYTARITLTAKAGYTLTGAGANTFTVAGALVAANPANSGVVTATFPATVPADTTINIRAISGVTAPATGEKPVTAITETAQYSGTVTWSPNAAAFAAGTAYTATIVVTPKAGYTLTGVGANTFTVAGASSVANLANSGVVTAVFPATASVDTTINLRAIAGVTVPVTGGIPVTTVTETAQYSGTVTWAPNNPVFAASTEYTAKITLTAKPGYTLSGVGSNAFTVAGAASVSNPPNSGVITVTFPATASAVTTINIRAIAGVTVPVTGEKPVTAVTETAQYTGTVTWAPNDVAFAPSTAYTATIVVTPKAGYTLSGVGANTFTVAGASTVANPANSGVVTAVFPATAPADTMVNIRAIAGVTVPVTGEKPVTAITETAQYSGTVTWTPNDAAFVASTAYTAKITLIAKAGYTLSGVGANTFTVAGASTVANLANSGVVTATFPTTASVDTMVNISAIAGVTVPVTGGKPVTAITDTAQYSGTVSWQPNDAVFAASTAYTAKITLTAKSGYTLSGVGANTFTVTGALSVTNPANSGVVTATFPATAAADTTINLRAIAGVTVPVTGGKPVTSITDTTQYSGTVTWSPNVSVFASSTAYTATIVVTAKPGYTLIGMGANTFTVDGALSVTHAANSGVITAIFPATEATVSLLSIGGITVPAPTGRPVTAITETAQYTGTVTWQPAGFMFAPSTVYTATINLTIKPGYTLTGVAANSFTVAGASAVNAANSGVITVVFPQTPPDTATINTSEAVGRMQDFVKNISDYARTIKNNFIILPNNGVPLAFINAKRLNGISDSYVNAIDGIGQEALFYDGNGNRVNYTETVAMLNIIKANKRIIVSDYVLDDTSYAESVRLCNENNFIPAPRTSENYYFQYIPSQTPQNENSNDITRLQDAMNFLYLLNASKFAGKDAMINAIAATNYDVVLIDLFYGATALQPSDIQKLKVKQNGGKRLVISYMNIGSAETFRYYWKDNQQSYILKPYPGYADEYYVAYWQYQWQQIMYGNDSSYVKKIIDAGFDGIHLDNVEAYIYSLP